MNLSKPEIALIWPNTGSIVAPRFLYRLVFFGVKRLYSMVETGEE
jgi:hypothetical protein